jgi:hypothetical protein
MDLAACHRIAAENALPRAKGPVTDPGFTMIERVILSILDHRSTEIPGRELRSLLRSHGFRRSAPALVFTMLRLQDKGAVVCREETEVINGVPLTERYYRLP